MFGVTVMPFHKGFSKMQPDNGPILMHGLLAAQSTITVALDRAIPEHRLYRAGDLIAIISQAEHNLSDPDLPGPVLEEAARKHDSILTAYSVKHTVLPIRFGAAFSDDRAIWRYLVNTEHAEAACKQLARLKGFQEFGIKLLIIDYAAQKQPQPYSDNGRDFLRQRAQLRAGRRELTERQAQFASEMVNALGSVSTDLRKEPSRSGRICDLSLLIDRTAVQKFYDTVSPFAQDATSLGLHLRTTGPWPAYSFAANVSKEETHVT